jgi:UDP-3-O-[3-hydroxymyristoyl] glucosamine N-acyltransferase
LEHNIIAKTAIIGENVKIGYFTIINDNVEIGNNVIIGNNVTIYPGTIIGAEVSIGDNSVIGKSPKPAKTSTVKLSDELPPLTIGEGTTIGTSAVIYGGSSIGSNSLIADLASVRENCKIGNYVIVGRGVAVENYVNIGDYTKIQTGSYITAYMEIEERVFIAPMVSTTNDNFMGRTKERFKQIKGATIKKGARVGGASILLPGVVIAEETFVAAGAIVTKDTKEKTVYKGFPAKELREVPENELLINQE